MRILFSAILLTFLNGGAIQPQIDKQPTAKISIERPENNGSINIVACVVEINPNQKIVLRCGQTNSFSVRTGKYFLKASSSNPYEFSSKGSEWKSDRLKIVIGDSQVVKIILEPKSKGSTYTGGWTLTVKNP
jgi:hypothetical protein